MTNHLCGKKIWWNQMVHWHFYVNSIKWIGVPCQMLNMSLMALCCNASTCRYFNIHFPRMVKHLSWMQMWNRCAIWDFDFSDSSNGWVCTVIWNGYIDVIVVPFTTIFLVIPIATLWKGNPFFNYITPATTIRRYFIQNFKHDSPLNWRMSHVTRPTARIALNKYNDDITRFAIDRWIMPITCFFCCCWSSSPF